MSGRNAVAFPYETELLSTVDQPCVRCEWVNSQKRRDLPTPGSPTTATTWPCPAPAASRACRRLSTFACRPDEGRRAGGRGRLQPRAHGARADDLKDLDRSFQTLNRPLSKGLHRRVPFHQVQRLG